MTTTTVVRAQWFPAIVKLPGKPERRGCMVILAEDGEHAGMHVWTKPDEVAWVHLPVDWSATTLPTGNGAKNGVTVTLADGQVAIVTAGQGCRCGSLGRWRGPAWATTVRAVSS